MSGVWYEFQIIFYDLHAFKIKKEKLVKRHDVHLIYIKGVFAIDF